MTDKRVVLPDEVGPLLYEAEVSQQSLFMRAKPLFDGSCDTEVLFGARVNVYRENQDWVWGQIQTSLTQKNLADKNYREFPGYIGWLPKSGLLKIHTDKVALLTHRVIALQAPVFMAPNIKSPVMLRLCLNTALALEEYFASESGPVGAGEFYKFGPYYIHKAHVSQNPQVRDFVEVAAAHLGLPYVWGGISTLGLDCSGLVRSSLRAVGRDAPRDADQQQALLGQTLPLDLEGLRRGDLVFWKGHVGVMEDCETLIHANAGFMQVTREPLRTAIKRIEPLSGKITALKRL